MPTRRSRGRVAAWRPRMPPFKGGWMPALRRRWIAAALAAGIASLASCAEDLPDAPTVVRARRTPLPFEPDPEPSASSLPGPLPAPTGAALPPAPRDGQLVRTGSGYLEFIATVQNGRLVFLVFPYDSRLAGIRGTLRDASGTVRIDGGSPVPLSPYTDSGEIFLYLYPRIGPGSHRVEISAIVQGVSFSGTFTHP